MYLPNCDCGACCSVCGHDPGCISREGSECQCPPGNDLHDDDCPEC